MQTKRVRITRPSGEVVEVNIPESMLDHLRQVVGAARVEVLDDTPPEPAAQADHPAESASPKPKKRKG